MSNDSDFIDGPCEVDLPGRGGRLGSLHVFEQDPVDAINSALAAGRPLLVRGEPGTGKSQLARAAAKYLGRAFVSTVVDARTEARDLLWTLDAVARLAAAQVLGAFGGSSDDRAALRAEVQPDNFVAPEALWWAFDWASAKEQAGRAQENAAGVKLHEAPRDWKAGQGTVLLIDEIDKADPSVPNGLLQALGDGEFPVPSGCLPPLADGEGGDVPRDHVQVQGAWPLVILTTNGERTLPDAFLRRCLVLELALPTEQSELVEWLVQRGKAHFPTADEGVLREAARQLAVDREELKGRNLSAPGQAEYLDLLRMIFRLSGKYNMQPKELVARLGKYVLSKHPAEPQL